MAIWQEKERKKDFHLDSHIFKASKGKDMKNTSAAKLHRTYHQRSMLQDALCLGYASIRTFGKHVFSFKQFMDSWKLVWQPVAIWQIVIRHTAQHHIVVGDSPHGSSYYGCIRLFEYHMSVLLHAIPCASAAAKPRHVHLSFWRRFVGSTKRHEALHIFLGPLLRRE